MNSVLGKTVPKRHEKGWGYEDWIVNDKEANYCGKLLFFKKGKKCSWHYHSQKEEVFYLESGKILLVYGFTNDLNLSTKIFLDPGDSFYVPAELRHQMIALEDSRLFEFSTYHQEEDSIRVIKGD